MFFIMIVKKWLTTSRHSRSWWVQQLPPLEGSALDLSTPCSPPEPEIQTYDDDEDDEDDEDDNDKHGDEDDKYGGND